MAEMVILKGTFDGIRIYIGAQAPIMDAVKELNDKLKQSRSFFDGAKCNIYVLGREFSASDKLRLETVISAHLPFCDVYFGKEQAVKTHKKHDESKERLEQTEDKQPKRQDADAEAAEAVEADKAAEADEAAEADDADEAADAEEEPAQEPESEFDRILRRWDDERDEAKNRTEQITRKWDAEHEREKLRKEDETQE